MASRPAPRRAARAGPPQFTRDANVGARRCEGGQSTRGIAITSHDEVDRGLWSGKRRTTVFKERASWSDCEWFLDLSRALNHTHTNARRSTPPGWLFLTVLVHVHSNILNIAIHAYNRNAASNATRAHAIPDESPVGVRGACPVSSPSDC